MTNPAIASQGWSAQQGERMPRPDVGYAFVDPHFRIVELNPTMAALLGGAVEQYRGQLLTEALPELATALLPLLQQAVSTASVNAAIEWPSQQGRWLINCFPVRTRAGTILGVDLEVLPDHGSTAQQPRPEPAASPIQLQKTILQYVYDLALVPMVIYLYDAIERRPLAIRVHGADFLGYTMEELLGEGAAFFGNLLHPADAVRVAAHFDRFADADPETIFEVEYRLLSKQGGWRWYVSHDRIFAYSADRQVRQILGAAQDITERKQIEEALRLSNERFRAALKGSPIIIFNQDHDLRYTWIYDPDSAFDVTAAIGKTDQQIFERAEDAAHMEAIKRQVLESGVGIRQEVRLRVRQHDLHYDLTIEPARDADQQIVGITCVAVNISERQHLEQNLRESEARFRTLVEANIVGIMMVNEQCIIYANDALLAMVGYTRDDMQAGRLEWPAMTPPEYLPLDRQAIAEIEANGSCTPFEKEYLRKDGSRVPILIGAALLKQEPTLWVAFVVDMTTHKQVEAERSALLESEQAARAIAQEAVRVRDAFFAVAAHELRNPLTAMLGQAQMLQRRMTQSARASDRDARSLSVIVEQAQRLNAMIGVLLDSVRLEQGQLQLTQAQINLPDLVHKLIAEERQSLHQHQISCEIAQDQLFVYGDELRLEQIFRNLLQNAIKYSPLGGRIAVRISRDDDQVLTSIADQGIGIPADALPRLFSQFYRAPNVQQYPSGLGIGLFVVKELVALHGGSIHVTSQEHLGSTFTVSLPLAGPQPKT